MKIHWAPNPLCTVIEPTDAELATMKLRVHIDLLEERMVSAEISISTGASATDDLNLDSVEAEVSRRMAYLVESLREMHDGDCICVPCSCVKCVAEAHLQVDTLKGLNKYEGCAIASAFRNEDPLRQLRSDEMPARTGVWSRYDEKTWTKLTEEWLASRGAACAWMEKYNIDHGFQ